MSFDVAAESYDRFMGEWSQALAPQLADLADVRAGQQALDVGCGPGALTAELVARLGAENVKGIDPSESFVASMRERHPEVDVLHGAAEALPFAEDTFDVALCQLVVHFMDDPVAGIREMRRVTRAGGAVAACVWDFEGRRGPLTVFWTAVRELDPDAADESLLPGSRGGDLDRLFTEAGLRSVEGTELSVERSFASFEEWWDPYTLGVGPAGAYASSLDPDRQAALRDRCRSALPEAPFEQRAVAWAARGVA
jgi:SAM-dependent methyltransferase